MQKDFDGWNNEKQTTHARKDVLLYRERDVRWCRLGVNIGYEQDGTGADHSRPVLILRAFSRSVCLIIPLTTSTKQNPYHVSVGTIGNRKAFAIISQLRLIDTKRLDQKIATLDKDIYESIRKTVKDML